MDKQPGIIYISIRNKGEVMKSRITPKKNVNVTMSQYEAGVLMTILGRIGGSADTTPRDSVAKLHACLDSIGVQENWSFSDKPFIGDVDDSCDLYGNMNMATLSFREEL